MCFMLRGFARWIYFGFGALLVCLTGVGVLGWLVGLEDYWF